MNDIIIEGRGLKRYYHRGSETVKALDGVDIVIRRGEIIAILGPSGSGKTTLINVLSCLDVPTDGTLTVAGKSVAGLSEDELVEVRRGVLGFVFQQFSLLPTLTVTENVELPLLFLGLQAIESGRTRFWQRSGSRIERITCRGSFLGADAARRHRSCADCESEDSCG
jgi:putative ABC transport system ATP-binding protein